MHHEKTLWVYWTLLILGHIFLVASQTLWIGAETSVVAANIVSGLAIALLSLPRGNIRESFGSWDRFVR